jgi:hypothetical protein
MFNNNAFAKLRICKKEEEKKGEKEENLKQ